MSTDAHGIEENAFAMRSTADAGTAAKHDTALHKNGGANIHTNAKIYEKNISIGINASMARLLASVTRETD